jgi:hypothetical protein
LHTGRQHGLVRAEWHVERGATAPHRDDRSILLQLLRDRPREGRLPDTGRSDEDETVPGPYLGGEPLGFGCPRVPHRGKF